MRRAAAGLGVVSLAVVVMGIGLFWTRSGSSPDAGVVRNLFPLVAEEGRLGLAVLGTSLTARADWPELLRDRIAACSGREVELARFAKPGAHSGWGLGQVPALIAAKPDLVLIEFTINDADIRDGIGRAGSRDNHAEIVRRIRAALPEASVGLLILNPPRGLRILTRPFLGRYREVYRVLAEEEGLGLLDLHQPWREALTREPRLAPDGLHPTSSAVAAVAQAEIERFVLAAVPGC